MKQHSHYLFVYLSIYGYYDILPPTLLIALLQVYIIYISRSFSQPELFADVQFFMYMYLEIS